MAEDKQAEPNCCPFCGDGSINYNLVEWDAYSRDTNDKVVLAEHQCGNCARSFWTA